MLFAFFIYIYFNCNLHCIKLTYTVLITAHSMHVDVYVYTGENSKNSAIMCMLLSFLMLCQLIAAY